MGPLNSAAQRDKVAAMLAQAAGAGAEVRELGTLAPGAATSKGHFLRPTPVLDPDTGLRIVTEEQFGPALPILPFDDIDSVVDRVNNDWSGPCSSVWSGDPARAGRPRGTTAYRYHLDQPRQRRRVRRPGSVRRLPAERYRTRDGPRGPALLH
ncbi:aldehyde dehydrogenase family protein [Streptomyces sp. NBC_00391]|uniref:aldehyde dehydrogenase family protein n=1 Tax=Streptomyces sp. NBC_00391 TaxID=2903647 RepID=UPI002E1EB841